MWELEGIFTVPELNFGFSLFGERKEKEKWENIRMENPEKFLNYSDWFQIKEVEKDVFVIEEPWFVQSYLINGKTHSALLDTGMGFLNIRSTIKPLLKEHVAVFNTHWHFDHIGGNALFSDIGIAANEAHLITRDIPNSELSQMLGPGFETEEFSTPSGFVLENYTIKGSHASFTINAGDQFDLGDRTLEAVATPGHTHGSMSFLDRHARILFVGDFVYQDTFFVQFEDSDITEYIQSLENMLARMDEFDKIYPAHGKNPLPNTFLIDVLAAFTKIKAGAKPDEIDHSWGEASWRYHFSEFNILVKPPGSKGIQIFPSN
jgi:glyoxylase-like metal-dependent hydrolase (beta-lactamase superfamily II)